MNVSTFFKHYGIRENPFLAEEARQDEVFARLQAQSPHPDFSKILGDLTRPASSVVFGEKGSGKTAIRLQLEEKIDEYNASNPGNKVLVIAYDEWNPVLDRFARRVRGKTPLESLQQLHMVDHIDGLLSVAVSDMVDALLGRKGEGHAELGKNTAQVARKLTPAQREDWAILQALYDRPDLATQRSKRFRRAIRFRGLGFVRPTRYLVLLLWIVLILAGGAFAWFYYHDQADWIMRTALALLAAITLLATGTMLLDRLRMNRLARQLGEQLRVLGRSQESWRLAVESLPHSLLSRTALPVDSLDEPRYALLERLRRAIEPFGYMRIIVLIDRVDEPTLVSGEVGRMKAVVWPLLNNKFLQQPNIAFKVLLPLELRHELNRQSSDFFQGARLDKQNLIDRLIWSGAMLYDLCSARINACLDEGAAPISLTQLFDEEVTRQDIVDALDQMRQPRDAFKMMYHLIQEHCSNTTEEDADWQIPKLVLDHVRRVETDRLEGLQRGIRPA